MAQCAGASARCTPPLHPCPLPPTNDVLRLNPHRLPGLVQERLDGAAQCTGRGDCFEHNRALHAGTTVLSSACSAHRRKITRPGGYMESGCPSRCLQGSARAGGRLGCKRVRLATGLRWPRLSPQHQQQCVPAWLGSRASLPPIPNTAPALVVALQHAQGLRGDLIIFPEQVAQVLPPLAPPGEQQHLAGRGSHHASLEVRIGATNMHATWAAACSCRRPGDMLHVSPRHTFSLGWRQRASAVTISSISRARLPTVARGTASLPTTTAGRGGAKVTWAERQAAAAPCTGACGLLPAAAACCWAAPGGPTRGGEAAHGVGQVLAVGGLRRGAQGQSWWLQWAAHRAAQAGGRRRAAGGRGQTAGRQAPDQASGAAVGDAFEAGEALTQLQGHQGGRARTQAADRWQG